MYALIAVGSVLLFCVGCEFLDPEVRQNPDGTVTETFQGAKYLEAAQSVSDMAAQTGIPLVSLAASGVSGLLAIATGILGKIAVNRKNVAKATILAIEDFTTNFDKLRESVLTVAQTTTPDKIQDINQAFDKLIPVKDLVWNLSKNMGIRTLVDSLVQKILISQKK